MRWAGKALRQRQHGELPREAEHEKVVRRVAPVPQRVARCPYIAVPLDETLWKARHETETATCRGSARTYEMPQWGPW